MFGSIDLQTPSTHFSSRLPRRGLGLFMIGSGLIILGVWLIEPFTALMQNQEPGLIEHSTTLVTHALDMAIIVPATIMAGVLILRGMSLRYLMAMSLLVLEVLLAPMIALQTVFQLAADVTFETAEIVGPFGGFVVIALIAGWFAFDLIRNVSEDSPHPLDTETTISVGIGKELPYGRLSNEAYAITGSEWHVNMKWRIDLKPLPKIAKVVFSVLLVLHGIAHAPGVWILEPRNLFVSLVVTTLWWKDAIAGLVINIGVLIILGGMMSRTGLQ